MARSLSRLEERQPEPPDLDLVPRRELGGLHALPIHVRAVQASAVVDPELDSLPTDLRVSPGHRHVVEEDVAVRAPPCGGRLLLDQEPGPRVWATLHHKQRLPGLETLALEGELLRSLIFDLDGGDAERRVLLQRSATVGTEQRFVLVRMSTTSAEHAPPSLTASLPLSVEVWIKLSTLEQSSTLAQPPREGQPKFGRIRSVLASCERGPSRPVAAAAAARPRACPSSVLVGLLDESPIRRGVHEGIKLGGVAHLQDRQPSVAVGLIVDELG